MKGTRRVYRSHRNNAMFCSVLSTQMKPKREKLRWRCKQPKKKEKTIKALTNTQKFMSIAVIGKMTSKVSLENLYSVPCMILVYFKCINNSVRKRIVYRAINTRTAYTNCRLCIITYKKAQYLSISNF